MEYDLKKWVLRTWITDRRYYIGEVKQMLGGEWVCRQRWGSRTSRFSRSRNLPATSYAEALSLLDATAKRRTARGYRLAE
ncbi:MAG: hypothetical protein AAFZ49_00610 [Cyanobacteria bacterium J06659_2]